jgi:hypothetical protein
MPATALFIALSLLAQGWEGDGVDARLPCADSLSVLREDGEEHGGYPWGQGSAWDVSAGEDCDPEAALLFLPDPQDRRPESRPYHSASPSSSRASFSLARNRERPVQSVLREQAARDGWDHRLEIRNDGEGNKQRLTRRRLGWRQEGDAGWRLVAGDLTDPALPLWPRRLPRRALPRGWEPAPGVPDAPRPLASDLPQGFAAGVLHPRAKAYALRSWNPVARAAQAGSGAEPPWHAAWDLRHIAAGASVSLPWTAALHLSETRVTRKGADSLSERLLAAQLASPGGGIDLIAARAATDVAPDGNARSGWLLGADFRHRFENRASIAFTGRQRDEGWASAWDPAYAPPTPSAPGDSADRDWGAGEARLSGRLPLGHKREHGRHRDPNEGGDADNFLRAEAWRAWNPAAGTSRQGLRGAWGRKAGGARLELSGTHRTARAASGSVSVYRYLEADTRIESGPRWRAAAWRAWNGAGPLRAGFFAGAEPALGSLRFSPGYRLEERNAAPGAPRWEGLASLGFRGRAGGGWGFDFSGALPCWPSPHAGTGGARWRLTLDYTGR